MKSIFSSTIIFVIGLMTFACGDKHEFLTSVQTSQGSKIKFLHAAPDAPAVDVYVNDKKVTAGSVSGTAIGYFSSFPVTDYTAFNLFTDANVTSATATVKVVIPATSNAPETTVLTTPVTLRNFQYYTVAVTGLSPNYEAFVIEDNIGSIGNDAAARLRFINLIPNATAVDVVVTAATITVPDPNDATKTVQKVISTPFRIYSNVEYKKGANTFSVLEGPGQYTIQIRTAGTNTVLATLATVNNSFNGNKIYTLVARGQIGGTGTRAPILDRVVNR